MHSQDIFLNGPECKRGSGGDYVISTIKTHFKLVQLLVES